MGGGRGSGGDRELTVASVPGIDYSHVDRLVAVAQVSKLGDVLGIAFVDWRRSEGKTR